MTACISLHLLRMGPRSQSDMDIQANEIGTMGLLFQMMMIMIVVVVVVICTLVMSRELRCLSECVIALDCCLSELKYITSNSFATMALYTFIYLLYLLTM